MKNTFLISFLFFHILHLFGQVNESKDFIYFFGDSIKYPKELLYKTPFLGKTHFLMDTIKVNPYDVKFYQKDFDFFANTSEVNFSGAASFAKRIVKGKINLYENITTHYSPGHYNANAGGFVGGGTSKSIQNYYNIGYEDLKLTTYDNLMNDLADNSQSMIYLNKYQFANKAQNTCYIVGGLSILTGLVAALNEPNKKAPPLSYITFGTGLTSLGIGQIFKLNKRKHVKKAIEVYNY